MTARPSHMHEVAQMCMVVRRAMATDTCSHPNAALAKHTADL